jgi:hypothetical protein
MKRIVLGAMAVVVALGGLVAVLRVAECQSGKVTLCNFMKLKTGMTVTEAEAILGPGQEYSKGMYAPGETGPRLKGERFVRWEHTDGRGCDRTVWVGVRGAAICGTFYWEKDL